MKIFGSMVFGAGLMASTALHAAVITVTPADPSWRNPSYENSATGSSSITGTAPRSGGGSVEMFGDRTRYLTGNQFNPASNLTALSNVTGLSFDWRVAGDSNALLDKDYTPALRLHVQDGAVRSELIWEGAYNNVYGNETKDTWYSTTFADLFYQNIAGAGGPTLSGGSQVNKTLQAWISDNYSASAYVTAISVGVGGSAGIGYHAFADNVVLGERTGNTTFNFETALTAVPEPASLALLGLGIAGMFAAGRPRRR